MYQNIWQNNSFPFFITLLCSIYLLPMLQTYLIAFTYLPSVGAVLYTFITLLPCLTPAFRSWEPWGTGSSELSCFCIWQLRPQRPFDGFSRFSLSWLFCWTPLEYLPGKFSGDLWDRQPPPSLAWVIQWNLAGFSFLSSV